MKISIPRLLTFNGGYVDTAGFLALQGLFTAHVTGNFVTLGATLSTGTSGAVAKLLALPTFCLIVALARYFSSGVPASNMSLQVMLWIKTTLLAMAAALALWLGPFADGDSLSAITTGLVLVTAMAIQNAVHRIHFSKQPATTLMTGTTTQIMIDLADMAKRALPFETRQAARTRSIDLAITIGIFALGCGSAAVFYTIAGMGVFILPPIVASLMLMPFPRAATPGALHD